MEKAASFHPVAQTNKLVEAVVILGDRGVRVIGFCDDAELVVGVVTPALISNLQNAPTLIVVAVTTQDAASLQDFSKLIPNVILESSRTSFLVFETILPFGS